MRRLTAIVSGFLLILTLAACGSPRQQAPSPASLLDPGSFRIVVGNQVFADAVTVTQSGQDDVLVTMVYDDGRIEIVFPKSLEPGTYRGCRMALYESGTCVDPLGMRFVSIENGVESEPEDYADLSLTLESTTPFAGSFRMAPDAYPILEGVFRAP